MKVNDTIILTDTQCTSTQSKIARNINSYDRVTHIKVSWKKLHVV